MAEQEMTFAQTFGGSRDMCCIAAVGNMASMGRFEEEFSMYGCAYLENGNVTYRISPVAEQMYEFVRKSAQHACYPTRVLCHRCNTEVPSGMREKIAGEVKLETARRLRSLYPQAFFTELEPLAKTAAQNNAMPLLEELVDAIDGHFEELELQLLEGTIQLAWDSKLLQKDSRRQLEQWVAKTRGQMADDPVLETTVSRIFYGFCYQEKGRAIQTVVNAQPVQVWEQQANKKRSGAITGPVLRQIVWFAHEGQIAEGRSRFRQNVQKLQSDKYFSLLQQLKALPGAVDTEAFQKALHRLEVQAGAAQAIEDLKGYGYQWNCL